MMDISPSEGIFMSISWIILMGIVGVALVTLLTVLVIAALVARTRHDGSGPGLTAVFGVLAVLLSMGLLLPFGLHVLFGLNLLSHAASVPGRAISVGTSAIYTAGQVAYVGATIPTRVMRHGSPALFMLLVGVGFMFLIWMLSKEKTRAVGSWILGIGAATVLFGGGLLLLLGVSHREARIQSIGIPSSPFVTHQPFVAERLARSPAWHPDLHVGVQQARQAVAQARNRIDTARRDIDQIRSDIDPLEMAVAIEAGPEPKPAEKLPAEAESADGPPATATADGESNEGETDDAGDSDEPAEPASDPSDTESAGDANEDSPADLTDAPTEPETAELSEAVAEEPKGETSAAAGDASKEGVDDPASSVSAEPKAVKAEPAAVVAEQPEEDCNDVVELKAIAKLSTSLSVGSGKPHDASAPQPMPDWVKVPPKLVGTSYRRTAVSDPFSTDDECRRQLRGQMMVITCEYLSELLGFDFVPSRMYYPKNPAEQFAELRLKELGISPVYIRKNICKDEYVEHIGSSVDKMIGAGFGQMRRIHVLMEFDDTVQNDLKRRWKDSRLVERLAVVGGGALSIVALLGLVFAYLKFDTVTKGYYTRRLQVAIGLVTILVVAALVAILG